MLTPQTFRISCYVLTLVAGCIAVVQGHLLFAQQANPSRPDIVGVVGRWSAQHNDGESIVLVEDSREHTRSSSEIEQIAASLFGRAERAFATNASAPEAFSLGVLPNVPHFAEGTFGAQFKLVSGASDQTAGLVFDLRPNGEYSFVRYNTKEGNVALWRYANGQRAVLARGGETLQLPLGVWHTLTITITGTRLVGTVNGTPRLEHALPNAVGGRLGFWAKRDSVTMFKAIHVQSQAVRHD